MKKVSFIGTLENSQWFTANKPTLSKTKVNETWSCGILTYSCLIPLPPHTSCGFEGRSHILVWDPSAEGSRDLVLTPELVCLDLSDGGLTRKSCLDFT